MRCPHCSTAIKIKIDEYLSRSDLNRENYGYEIISEYCPMCNKLIVISRYSRIESVYLDSSHDGILNVDREEILFPKGVARRVELEVPSAHKEDYTEASIVLQFSAKASAALSRRLLQNLLREEFGIEHRSLAQEIDAFIQRKDVPTYLAEAVDAVRNIGNFAAHPLKDTNTGEIVDVEPGEAEWLLEVLDSLFDFAFVQPRRLAKRRKKLNSKLKSIGKPPMKG